MKWTLASHRENAQIWATLGGYPLIKIRIATSHKLKWASICVYGKDGNDEIATMQVSKNIPVDQLKILAVTLFNLVIGRKDKTGDYINLYDQSKIDKTVYAAQSITIIDMQQDMGEVVGHGDQRTRLPAELPTASLLVDDVDCGVYLHKEMIEFLQKNASNRGFFGVLLDGIHESLTDAH